MYNPPVFKRDQEELLRSHVAQFPLGILASVQETGLQTSYIPFIIHEGGLEGHLTLFNPHVAALQETEEVTVMFPGTNGYISPDWYLSENLAPTWNFVTAHVMGSFRIVRDGDGLLDLLGRQITQYERAAGETWSLGQMDRPVRDDLMRHIIGVRIEIKQFELKYKLSQNRSQDDFDAVVEALRGQEGRRLSLAELMAAQVK